MRNSPCPVLMGHGVFQHAPWHFPPRPSRLLTGCGIPPTQAVAFPESTEEVASIVRAAAAHRTPIVPFGAGTRWVLGAVCVFGVLRQGEGEWPPICMRGEACCGAAASVLARLFSPRA